MSKFKLFVYGFLETTHIYPGTPVNLHEVIHHLSLLFKSCLLHNALEGKFYVNFANWEAKEKLTLHSSLVSCAEK